MPWIVTTQNIAWKIEISAIPLNKQFERRAINSLRSHKWDSNKARNLAKWIQVTI